MMFLFCLGIMKLPSSVVWQLTKKWNSQLVKFNGQHFSHDPLNLTNLHNATACGFSNEQSIGLSGRKESAKKGSKRVITLTLKHKSHNKIAKRKQNSQSKLNVSVIELKRGMNRIGKVVKGLSNVSEKTKKIALKRLQRLHVSTRSTVKGGAKKE